MKKHQKLVLFLSASFLAITTMLFNPYVYELRNNETNEYNSQNSNDLDLTNSNVLEESNSYEIDQIKTITTTFFNSLNEKNIYYFEPNKSYIENNINHSKLTLNGELHFDSSTLSSYNLNGIYSYSSNKEFINLTLTKESNLTSLNVNSKDVLVNKNKDINSTFAYFEGSLKEENPYSSKSLGRSNLDMLNNSSLGLTTIFNDAFIELQTSNSDEINISYIDLLEEYKIDTTSYSLYFDTSYNLKRLSNNKSSSKTANFDIDLFLNNKINSIDDVIEETSSLFETLFEYLKGTSLSSLLDITLDDSKNNKTFHFVGDMSLDFTNYDLVDNGILDLNLKHYTDGNTANDIFLRYQDTNIFFQDGNLIKGRMEDKTIGETIKSLDNLLDNNLISQYIDNPLNSIFNNIEFQNIFDAIESMDLDLLSLFDSLKNLSIRHNVISFDMDGANFNLPSNLIHFEIGLANLKLKTIKISNLKVNDDINLDLKVRIMPFKNLLDLDLNDYPSYDFIPGALDSIDRLLRTKKLGGSLSLDVISKDGAHTLISSDIDANLSKADFSNLETISDADLALTNITINDVDKDGNPTTIQQALDKFLPLSLRVEEDVDDARKMFLDVEGDNLLTMLFGHYLKFDLDALDSLLGQVGEISPDLINSILSLIGLGDLDLSNIENLFDALISMIGSFGSNEQLEKIIKKVTEDYSLLALEELAGEYPFIYNDGYNFVININPEVLLGFDMDTTYGDVTTSSTSYVPPTISFSWNTTYNRLNSIFINMEIPKIYNLDAHIVQFSYLYDYFNSENFLTDSEKGEYKEPITFGMQIIDFFKAKHSLLTPNKYNLNLGLNDTPDLIDATLGLKDNKYAEGKVKINTQSSIINNPEFQFIYDNRYSDILANSTSINKRYFDGNIVYEDILSGLEQFKEGTLQANVKLDTVNNSQSTLKVYSSANSLFDIVTNVLEISEDNILYPYVNKLLTFIENLFSGNNILLFQIIKSGEFIKLLDQEYIKKIDYSFGDTNISLRLELNPSLLDSPDSSITYDKNIVIDVSFDYLKDGEDSYQITLKHLLIDTPVLAKIKNFKLELKDSGEKFDEPIKNEDGSSTSFSVLDDTFEAYDPNHKEDYVNLDDVKKLVEMGINTTEFKYFEIKGKLNLGVSLDIPIIGNLVDFSKLIEPQYVTAKIELMKPEGSDLYSQTRAHVTIDRNNYGLFSNESRYVEFFTERTKEGKEIAYISSITGQRKAEESVLVEDSKVVETINNTDNSLYKNELSQKYPNHIIESKEVSQEEIYSINKDENARDKEFNRLQSEHPEWKLTKDKEFVFNRFSSYYKYKILKSYFNYSIKTQPIYEIIPEHNEYSIETFKVTQEELLGSIDNIPNLVYYLMDYSLMGKLGGLGSLVSREDLIGIINYQISTQSSSSNSNGCIDYISSVGNFNSTGNSFSMNLNLYNLLQMDGFDGINLSLYYGSNDEGTLLLQSLIITGSGTDNKILDDFNYIDASLKFEAVASIKKEVTNEFDRYNSFIDAFTNSEYTRNLGYHQITGYKNSSMLLTVKTKLVQTNGVKANFMVSALETGVNAGFIYGLE